MARTLLKIGGWLALGVVANVAVAWGFAAWGAPPHSSIGKLMLSHSEAPGWLIHERTGPGVALTYVKTMSPLHRGAYATMALIEDSPDADPRVARRFADRPDDSERFMHFFDERGWPFRSMRSEGRFIMPGREREVVSDVEVQGGVQIGADMTARGGWGFQRVRALPFVPVWPGFLINTLCFAVAAWIVLGGSALLIRLIGVRRAIVRTAVAAVIAPVFVVGVAFGAARKVEPNYLGMLTGCEVRRDAVPDERYFVAERLERTGGTRLIFVVTGHVTRWDGALPGPVEAIAPKWARGDVELAREGMTAGTLWLAVEGVGWPARAMRSSFERYADARDLVITQGHPLTEPPALVPNRNPQAVRVYPNGIIWGGFTLNWLLYAIALFMVVATPAALRRGLRIRRGRCIECGYDLRGSGDRGCPECGSGRAPSPGPPEAGA